MTRRIAILPDAVADQIAAGEVVERPASVVRELVENALDAGSTEVRVALENGGKTLIEVSDNGSGMGRDDAVLALDRHATSKIRTSQDLIGVKTFGFRGEALPAIASVSRFTLTTSEENGEGTELTVTGGRLERVAMIPRQQGTTVTVRSLFFNTPARRKFLRSASSETRAAHDAVATLALAHPEAGFELEVDGTVRLAVIAGESAAERLASVWGRDLASTLLPVHYAVGGFEVTGFVQRPSDAQPTGRRTQLFVNERPFRDPFLVRAAEAGYRTAIHPGDRPSLYLDIRVAAEDVDVNVHPAKLEVRFRDRVRIERGVEEAVRHTLGALTAAAPVGSWRPAADSFAREPWQPAGGSRSVAASSVLDDLFKDQRAEAELENMDAGFAVPLLQLFNSYILYEAPEGLIIVDQHSAHERVLYESVMEQLAGRGAPAQRLLLPLTLDLTDEELDVIEQQRAKLEQIGFEVEGFGGRTVMIRTVPSPHPHFDAVRCFREIVADLARGRFGGWANQLERFGATYACRAAVKAGERMDDREMRELLLRLLATTLPPHDVHGRATMVQLPREELERRFGRR